MMLSHQDGVMLYFGVTKNIQVRTNLQHQEIEVGFIVTKQQDECLFFNTKTTSSGTGIFKHKPTGLIECPRLENGETDRELLDKIYKDSQDYTKWELVDKFANIYNRLIIYRGDFFHQSLDYFGQDKYDGRLFQTFFFNTEK